MKQRRHLILTIDTSNAAFDDNEGAEVARMLRTAARDFIAGGPLLAGAWPLRDTNGNTCGRLVIARLEDYTAARDRVRDALPDTDSAAHRALDEIAD